MAALAVHDADIHGGKGQQTVHRVLHPVVHEVQRRSRQKHRGVVFQIGFQQLLIAVPDGADPRRHQPACVAAHTGAEIFLICVDDAVVRYSRAQRVDGGQGCRVILWQQVDDQQIHSSVFLSSNRMGV